MKKLNYMEERWKVHVGSYMDNCNMAVIIECKDGDDVITVNLGNDIGNGSQIQPFMAFLDTNNCPHIAEAIEAAGLAKPYIRFGQPVIKQSGYVSYPLYVFDEKVLREYNSKEVNDYVRSIA